MKILIAEDDPIAQHLLRGALIVLGHEVILAANGIDAWNELQSDVDYPLAILDLVMPGMNGLEICERTRTKSKTKPTYIILLTGDTSRKGLLSGLAAGANDYLTKPFDPAELRARVKVACEFVSTQREWAERAERFERALDNVKRLEGLLSVCAHCKSIRNENEDWQRLEEYIMDHTDALCSHGICPECSQSFRAEVKGHKSLLLRSESSHVTGGSKS